MHSTVVLIVVLAILSSSQLVSAATRCSTSDIPMGNISFVRPDDRILAVIQQMFPEKKAPNDSVMLNTSYVYTMTEKGYLNITFLNSGGGIRSSLGYYTVNVNFKAQNIVVLFPDQTCARVGDVLRIGPFEKGTQLGFTMTAPQNTTGEALNATFWSDTSAFDQNPDGIPHVAVFNVNGTILLGFEDVLGGGDMDFNDIIIAIDASKEICNSTCPDNYWECCRTKFLDADLGKILGLATALGLVIERFLEFLWSFFNLPTFGFNPKRPQPQPGGILAPRRVPDRMTTPNGPYWRLTIGPENAEHADIQFDELKAAIAVYQEKAKKSGTIQDMGDLLALVNWKSQFQAAAARELSFRLIISFIFAVGLGILCSWLANMFFVLCWCRAWVIGVGIFAGILSPFVHQFFELTFRLQRYLKADA